MDTGDWWHIFHSRQLNKLVEIGIANNQALAAAKSALQEATYTLYAEKGSLLYPGIDFTGLAERLQTSPLSVGVPSAGTATFDVYNANFQASYLLDIWGASRRQIEGYAAAVDFQKYEMLGTYLTLTTNIVTTTITVASLDAQMAATRKLIDAQTEILRVIKKQRAVGGVDDQAVLSQEKLLSQAQALLPVLQKMRSTEWHTLSVLLGQPTSDTLPSPVALNTLQLPSALPVSLPAKMVTQRPDIQAAQATMHQASANIGVVTSYLLPQISITSNYGFLSSTTNNFFDSSNVTWGIGGNILQPIFHGGQVWMARKAAIAAFNQTKAQYRQTVLQAFKNISDALRAIQYDAQLFQAQTKAERSARDQWQIVKKQYQVGGENYLAVLQADVVYQQAMLDRLKTEGLRYTDTAGLYQALGGGWWNREGSLS